jgi:hypothetical protein
MMFNPQLSLVQEPDGEYTVQALTICPNSCYRAGGVIKGAPSGVVVTPETHAFQLLLRYRGPICLQVLTPVEHDIQNLRFGDGKSSVTCFAVLDGKVLGAATASPLHHVVTVRAASSMSGAGVAAFRESTEVSDVLSAETCIEIVVAATDKGSLPNDDSSVTLQSLGVVPSREDVFKSKVQRGVRDHNFRIKLKDIKGSPANTVSESAGSVQSNATPAD